MSDALTTVRFGACERLQPYSVPMTPQRLTYQSLLAVLVLWLGGCTMLGPDFQTPEAQVPETWSEQESGLFQKPSKDESIAWWTQFNDPVLDKLVQTAYAQNLSLRSAGIRIMEARAQLGFVKGQLYRIVFNASGTTDKGKVTQVFGDRLEFV